MADEIGLRGGELEVTPEEARFLKRFFRRQAAPWFLLLAALALASAWWSPGGGDAALEARTSAALAQLRSENQRLLTEVADLSTRMEAGLQKDHGADELERRVEDAKHSVRMIEARVTAALERRLDELESRSSNALPARTASATQPPPDASAWDVSAILDRLYALEMRQERDTTSWESGRASAAQVKHLEERVVRLEHTARLLPAAPAPE